MIRDDSDDSTSACRAFYTLYYIESLDFVSSYPHNLLILSTALPLYTSYGRRTTRYARRELSRATERWEEPLLGEDTEPETMCLQAVRALWPQGKG